MRPYLHLTITKMHFKIVVCVALAAVFASTTCAVNEIIDGHRRPGDRMLTSQGIYVPSAFFGHVSKDVVYPQGQPLVREITMIMVLNNRVAGDVTNYRGGVGFEFVSFTLTSAFHHGLHYNFTLYGYPA